MGIGIAVCLFFAGLLAPMVASAQGAATLSTDKADYHPGEIVHITGIGYAPDTEYAVPVKRPDGSIVTIDPSTHVATPGWHTVTTDAGGHLVYDYQLNGVQGSYEARAYPAAWSGDWSETPVASATFTDAATGDLDQCANGPLSAPVQCAGTAWQNGNLNATKAHYLEGDSIPYRLKFNGLATGATVHTVTIAWDTTDSGKHGIDYLTSYDRTEATADPCSDILAAACGSFDTEPIPIDTNVTNGPDNLPTGTDNITQAPGSSRSTAARADRSPASAATASTAAPTRRVPVIRRVDHEGHDQLHGPRSRTPCSPGAAISASARNGLRSRRGDDQRLAVPHAAQGC